ncbi:alpha/beta fold hydrolase [Cytobacillus depressus]|uniref:Alpha/beta fold hydrolase n=1 Tax=Cytobacillus depressus TaxID=1602942 RepID=A0A6L3VAW7_9BACI|nr:S9 family peptidase [Cytobacillus depressus]KAB2336652.1 alpha/beta fold hydrolase [Cytobacillus depressus]
MEITIDHKLNHYLNVHTATQPKIIPNSHTITFITKKTGIPQVWTLDMQSAEIEQFTNLNDRVLSVYHSPSGKKAIIGMDHHGNEKQQFYIKRAEGTVFEKLVVSNEHFHNFGGWSPDEKKIAYSSNRRHPGYFDVFVMDVETMQEEAVYEFDGNCTPLLWLKDGKQIVLRVQETNIDSSLYILDVEKKELTRIGDSTVYARYQSLVVTNDKKGGYVLSDIHHDTLDVYRLSFDVPADLQKVFSVDRWDVVEISLSPNEMKLAYTVNEGGIYSLRVYDLGTGEHTEIYGIPSGVIESISWLDEENMIFCLKTPTVPGDIWSASINDSVIERLTFLSKSEDIEHLWMEPELCTFSSFDGLEVPYFIYGKKEQSQPVVVYVHGGPESQIKAEFNPVIQYLAGEGYAVVAPNVRGSMGYGRNYVQLDDARKRMDAVADLSWLVQDLINNRAVDKNRIGIMGRSYGGFMVLAALTHYPHLWAAGVDIVGISHFRTFLENTGPWRRRLRECEYGSLENDSEFFEEIAPLNHTNKISVPLLIFHGRNDTRVPVTEAEQLAADLRSQDKEVELVIFDDEGHQTERIENHIKMNSMIVAFMNQHLKG